MAQEGSEQGRDRVSLCSDRILLAVCGEWTVGGCGGGVHGVDFSHPGGSWLDQGGGGGVHFEICPFTSFAHFLLDTLGHSSGVLSLTLML